MMRVSLPATGVTPLARTLLNAHRMALVLVHTVPAKMSFLRTAVLRPAATPTSQTTRATPPAIILVHASGAEDREYMLPFARFLIRRGFAVLGYDKRGVGGSTGDWHTASFADLASDVVAAFEYLKTRSDIDPASIGLLRWSQAGCVMPVAAVRAPRIAFLISVSGAGIPVAEPPIDGARNEMTARGRKPEVGR